MSLSYDLAMQGYFGLYAATMSTVPDLVWGPGGVGQLPYWAKPLGDGLTAGGFFARMVGLNFGLLVLGRTHFGVSEEAFTKQTVAFHLLSLIFFVPIARSGGAVWTQWVWQLQCVINIVLALWGAQTAGLIGGGAKPKRSSRAKRK